jgi:hypothetical protein
MSYQPGTRTERPSMPGVLARLGGDAVEAGTIANAVFAGSACRRLRAGHRIGPPWAVTKLPAGRQQA